MNHFAKASICALHKPNPVYTVEPHSSSGTEELFIDSITTINEGEVNEQAYAFLEVAHSIRLKLDTGATANVISAHPLKKLFPHFKLTPAT